MSLIWIHTSLHSTHYYHAFIIVTIGDVTVLNILFLLVHPLLRICNVLSDVPNLITGDQQMRAKELRGRAAPTIGVTNLLLPLTIWQIWQMQFEMQLPLQWTILRLTQWDPYQRQYIELILIIYWELSSQNQLIKTERPALLHSSVNRCAQCTCISRSTSRSWWRGRESKEQSDRTPRCWYRN